MPTSTGHDSTLSAVSEHGAAAAKHECRDTGTLLRSSRTGGPFANQLRGLRDGSAFAATPDSWSTPSEGSQDPEVTGLSALVAEMPWDQTDHERANEETDLARGRG